MRVAVDARTLQEPVPGGIGRSLANMLPLLALDVDLLLLTDSRMPPVALDLPQEALPTPVAHVSASWLQISAARRLRRFDGVFHCPFYGLPYALSAPGVVTLHDLTFEHFPHWYSRQQTLAFRLQARRAARSARCILTVSEFVKADIVRTYGVDPEDVLVAPHGVDPVFRPDLDADPVLRRLAVTQPFVIALGGAARRHSEVAIAAWRRVRAVLGDLGLVVVGGPPPGKETGLTHVTAPDDQTWSALLAAARAFVYPTTYEGFGMPALEALGAGTPVVAARVGSLPEVLGEHAAWADSPSADDIAESLQQLLGDEERRQALRQGGLTSSAARSGWQHAAAVHLEAYRRAAR